MLLPDTQLMEMEFKRLDDGGKGLITWQKLLENYNKNEKINDEHFTELTDVITYDTFCTFWKAKYIY